MKATLTTCTFEMMYYETRGGYCNPAEKFLSYTEFKKMFESALFEDCNINELATAIYNKAIDNGATEEAALHAALFVFSFTAGKQAARKWFDELVAAEQSENNSSDDNSESAEQSENNSSDDNSEVEEELKLFGGDLEIYLNTYVMFDDTKDGDFMPIINKYRINCIDRARQLKKKRTSKENTELVDAVIAALKDAESGAKALLKLCECFIEDTFDMTNEEQRTKVLEILKDYLPKSKPEEDPKDPDPKDPPESGAAAVIDPAEEIFEPIEVLTVANDINPVKEFISLKTLMDDLYSTTDRHAIEDKASTILGKMRSIASMINLKQQSDITTEEHLTLQYIDALEKVVPAVEPTQLHLFIPVSYKNFNETEDKDLAIKNLSKVVNVRSEIRSPLEAIATSNGGTPVDKKPIPDVEEAYLLNGKEFSDSDLVTILKNKITVLEGRNVSRNSINMLLNLVMNNKDGFVTKLIDLGAKIPLEIKEVEVTKYTTDKNRFDTVFEITTANVNAPIIFFYHWDPILNEEGTAWTYDALVLPFDKVTLTKDAKKAKADSKRQKKTKKQTTEQPASQPQAMTATA